MASKTYTHIPQDVAQEMMASEEGYVILDVRTHEEYQKRRIPGAVNIPVDRIAVDTPGNLPDKDQLIFVYCRSGNRSQTAAQELSDMGYTRVYEFGGIDDWSGGVEERLDGDGTVVGAGVPEGGCAAG